MCLDTHNNLRERSDVFAEGEPMAIDLEHAHDSSESNDSATTCAVTSGQNNSYLFMLLIEISRLCVHVKLPTPPTRRCTQSCHPLKPCPSRHLTHLFSVHASFPKTTATIRHQAHPCLVRTAFRWSWLGAPKDSARLSTVCSMLQPCPSSWPRCSTILRTSSFPASRTRMLPSLKVMGSVHMVTQFIG
jgi:hypothetical protein